MTFERAAPEDGAEIVRILREASAFLRERGIDQWQRGMRFEEETKEAIARGEQYLVRTVEGAIAGVCTVQPYDGQYDVIDGRWQSVSYLAVHRVAVSPQYRRRGVTGVLYAGAERLARAAGKEALRADTHPENVPMRGVFAKHGFVLRGTIRLKTGEERIAFERVIV